MRVIVLSGKFGVEQLGFETRAKPVVAVGHVLLRMRSASINYRDLLMVRGQYNPKQPLPLVPLSDGVGQVVEVGGGVTRVRVGDRACPIFAPRYISGLGTREQLKATLGGPLDGVLQEYFMVHEDAVVVPPEHLSDAEAACLPCAAVTAWSALVTQAALKSGDVLVTQGSGGVALFALQFGKLLGARVIALSSSAEKLARLRALGADEIVNYRDQPTWSDAVRGLTEGRGADHVIDVGGSDTLRQSLRALRPGGTVSVIGNLSGSKLELDLLPILMQNIRLQGVFVGSRDSFEAMNQAIAGARLKPVIDSCLPWTEVRAAFQTLSEVRHFGKICLSLDAP